MVVVEVVVSPNPLLPDPNDECGESSKAMQMSMLQQHHYFNRRESAAVATDIISLS